MNWKVIFKTAAHAALGGAAVALAVIDPHHAITAGNVLLPILAGAGTSVVSLYASSPLAQPVIALVQAILTAKSQPAEPAQPEDPQAK